MKKLFLLPVLFFLASCAFTDTMGSNAELEKLHKIILPAQRSISEYQLDWNKARTNIILWVNTHGQSQSKMELKKFVADDLAKMKAGLVGMVKDSVFDAGDSIPQLCYKMDALAIIYKDIMDQLSNFESYERPEIVFATRPLAMEPDEACEGDFRAIDARLQRLKQKAGLAVEIQLQKALH
jgi:hypothetical protein